MHKNTKLLPYQRREAYRRWRDGDRVTELAKYYRVSRKTLYAVFHKAKLGVFENYSSKNLRFRTIEYGFKRLLKTERKLAKKLLKRELRANRYVKNRPGEMVHTDSSVLPLISGEAIVTPKEYLYVFIDDCSRTLFADILPDQTSYSAAIVLDEALTMLPFPVECIYSDNGKEFKGAFKALCAERCIPQQFTRPYRPQTNGKAERVIKRSKDSSESTASFRGKKDVVSSTPSSGTTTISGRTSRLVESHRSPSLNATSEKPKRSYES
jgi:transposase InsO family protein